MLVLALLLLALLLAALDRVTRAVLWESLRHPLTRSRLKLAGGKLTVTRGN